MNTELISRLDDWARSRERRIWPHDFHCPHYECCKRSLGDSATLDGGKTCSMSYVGKDYGLPVSGKPFKLAFVGIDRGYKGGGEDFAEMQSGGERWFYRGEANFNQHILGVIETAVAILGQAGQYCQNRCLQQKKCRRRQSPQRRAMHHKILCAAESGEVRSGGR